jgi:hypothetical protein
MRKQYDFYPKKYHIYYLMIVLEIYSIKSLLDFQGLEL